MRGLIVAVMRDVSTAVGFLIRVGLNVAMQPGYLVYLALKKQKRNFDVIITHSRIRRN